MPFPDFRNLVDTVVTGGMDFEEDVERVRKVLLMDVFTLIAVVTVSILGVVAFRAEELTLSTVSFFAALVLLSLFLYQKKTGKIRVPALLGTISTGGLFTLLFITGGVNNAGHTWFYTLPLFSAFLLGARTGALLSILFVLCALALQISFRELPWAAKYDSAFHFRFLISYTIVTLLAFFFEVVRAGIQRKLEHKNDQLEEKVSELRATEEALQRTRDELEQRVEERTAALQKAVEYLQQQIVERERAERALLDSHERFVKVLEGIDADVYVADLRTYEVLFVNRRMRESTGGSGMIGQPCWKAVRGRSAPCEDCANYKLLEGDGRPAGLLTWEGTNPVTGRWYVYHARAVTWDRNRMVRLQIAMDITDRKEAEEALQRANEELEMRVRERTDNIARINEALRIEIRQREVAQAEALRARDAAEQANRAKSEFLANMSHELRTPLNHVIGFTELVTDKRVGDLNQDQEEYLRDVLGSSRHLLSLINDILDLSKVEAGKMALEASEVNIRSLLESSLVMVKETAMKHQIRLALDYDSIPERIRVDERKLKQVMYNLLSNAVKFTPDGGAVHVGTSFISSTHDSSTGDHREQSLAADHIRICVSDTGIGIKKEDLERIFAPFEQVDSSVGRKYKGTGLGLSLTRRFVELHGGKIWAESEGEGKGSTFVLLIPSEPAPEQRGK
jgi:signal transduction histidine kinase